MANRARPCWRCRRERGEEGVSLVIALVFLAVIGLITAFLLSLVQVSFKTNQVSLSQSQLAYAADGGIESAINQAREGSCPYPMPTATSVTANSSLPGTSSVTSSCQTTAGSSLVNTFGGAAGSPGYSVITNSPSSINGNNGCISLDSDTVSLDNKASSNKGCVTYGNPAAPPTEWAAGTAVPSGFSGTDLNSVSAVPNTGSGTTPADLWAVGKPQGSTWGVLNYNGTAWSAIPTSGGNGQQLNNVYAIDANDIVAVGQGGYYLFCSSTACTAYQLTNPLNPSQTLNTNLSGVWGYSANGGATVSGGTTYVWVVGQQGSIYLVTFAFSPTTHLPVATGQTTEGSSSITNQDLYGIWGMVYTCPPSPPLGCVSTVSLWAVGNNSGGNTYTVLATTATPATTTVATWTNENVTISCSGCQARQLLSVSGVATGPTSAVLWAVGQANGGNSWTLLKGVGQAAPLNGGSGTSWSLYSGPSSVNAVDLHSVTTVDSNDAWAVGQNGTIIGFNGAWSAQGTPSNQNLFGVTATGLSSGNAWAVGQNGTFWYFTGPPSGNLTNGGPPWVNQTSNTNQSINSVFVVPSSCSTTNTTPATTTCTNVWAVGQNQGNSWGILHSTNGTTWNTVNVSIGGLNPQQLYGVWTDSTGTNVWAVGQQGTILYSSNSGATWVSQGNRTTLTNQDLLAVYGTSASNVIAVGKAQGNNYTVLTGGSSGWSAVSAANLPGGVNSHPQDLDGVYASGSTDFAVGNNNGNSFTILYSTNSGATWTAKSCTTNCPQGTQLFGVGGFDGTDVWAVGKQSQNTETILRWDGTSWFGVGPTSQHAQDLNGVAAFKSGSAENIWAVGQNGQTYLSSDGVTWTLEAGPSNNSTQKSVSIGGLGNGGAWSVGQQGDIWNFNPTAITGISVITGGPVFNESNTQFSSTVDLSGVGMTQAPAACAGQPTIPFYIQPKPTWPPSAATNPYSCAANAPTVNFTLPPNPSTLGWGSGCVPGAVNTEQANCTVDQGSYNLGNVLHGITYGSGGSAYTCVTLIPGLYANVNMNLNQNNTTYYFSPGVYYFDNSQITVNGNNTYLLGGTTSVESTNIASKSPCVSHGQISVTAPAGSASGVQFIMGGNSVFNVQAGNVEMYGRSGGNTANEGGFSVDSGAYTYQDASITEVPCSAGSGWDPSGSNNDVCGTVGNNLLPNQDQLVTVLANPGGGAVSSVDIHGSIYSPDHNVSLDTIGDTANGGLGLGTTVGALDVWSLELSIGGGENPTQAFSAPVLQIAAAGPMANRTVSVLATSTGSTQLGGGASISASVILGPPNISDGVEEVDRWLLN